MKNFIKITVAVSLSVILLLTLAACGDGGNIQSSNIAPSSSGSTDPGESSNTPPSNAGKERVTITYSMWGDDEELRVLQEEVIPRFEAQQDRISVEAIQIPRTEYEATINTYAAGRTLPDTAIMAESQVLSWASQGMLHDISGMYSAVDIKPLDSLRFTFQGNTVGYSVANEVLLLYYNRDKFTEAGVAPPPAKVADAWDWDAFIDIAKQMTFDTNGNNAKSPDFDKNNIKQYGIMLHPDFWQLEVWSVTNGSGWYDADGNVTIDDPAAIESLQRIADLHLVHNVMPQYGTNANAEIDTHLLENCAMFVNGQWSVGVWLGPARASDGLNYGVGVLPYMKEKWTINTGGVNVVFASSQHPDESMEWLKWYAKEENAWALIESGIWMPVLEEYYTNETLTRKWVENPNFPPYEEYKSAVVDYARTNAKPTSWYYVNNTDLFNETLSTLMAPVWTGRDTADNVIKSNIAALRSANRGN